MATGYTADPILASSYGWFKRDYDDAIRNTLNQTTPMLDKLEPMIDRVTVQGEGLYWPLDVQRMGGFHAYGENATLTVSQQADEVQANTSVAEMWGRAEFTARAKALATAKGSFADVQRRNAEKLVKAARENIGRQLIGNKVTGNTNTGILGLCNGAVSNDTAITVDNCNPFHFYKGQLLAIGTSTELGAGTAVEVKVSSVAILTATTCTITATAAVTLVDNDLIVEGSIASATSNGYNREMVGLTHIVDSAGSLFGVDPSTYPTWAAAKISVSSEPWSQKMLNKLLVGIENKAGMDNAPNVLALNKYTYLEFEEDIRPDRRYAPRELKMGVDDPKPTYVFGDSELELVMDPFVKIGDILAVNTDVLGIAWAHPLGFFDLDGQDALRVTDKVNVEVIYGGIGAIVGFERHCHGLLTGVSVDTDGVVLRN